METIPEWKRPIIKMPLTQAFPQLEEVKEFRSKICLFNHDRTKIYDVVSPKYQVVEHGTAFDSIDKTLKEYFGKQVESNTRSLNNGARIFTTFKLTVKPKAVDRGDLVEVNLTLRNSYDRSWTFGAMLGGFRLICSNGLLVGMKFGSISGRHSGNNTEALFLDQVESLVSRTNELRELWQRWKNERIDFNQAFDLLEGKFPTKYLTGILVKEKFPKTRWELYNDLTSFATHDTRSFNRRIEFDEQIAKLFYTDEALDEKEVREGESAF